MSSIKGIDAPAIMRIGAARLTAGLDRMPRLDLDAHRELFGPLPRLSAEELIARPNRSTCAARAAPRSRSRASSEAVVDAPRRDDARRSWWSTPPRASRAASRTRC